MISLPRNSISLRGLPFWSVRANGPPIGPWPYIKPSIICAADGCSCSAAATRPQPNMDAMTSSAHAAERIMACSRSDTEADPGAGRRGQNLARHLPLRFQREIQSAAMHGNENVRAQFGNLADDLRQIIRRRRPEVETAHDRVNFRNTRYFHRLPHGIDDADMAAGADDDQTLVLQIEARRVLVNMLIRHDLAFHFRGQIMARIASGAILQLELDHGVGEHFFDAVALDLAGRERLAADHHRRLTENELDVLPRDVATVEHAEVAQIALPGPGVALAEIVLATGIHRQIRGQILAMPVEKSKQTAPVIEMTMAQNQRVDLRRVDLEQVHVAVDGLRRPTIVKQERAFFVGALWLQQQRQSPFAVQRTQQIRGTTRLRPDAARFLRPEEDIAGAIDQNADAELVDGRHLDGTCLGHLDAGESAGRSRQRQTGGHLQRISSIEIGHRHLSIKWDDKRSARRGPQRLEYKAD